MYEVRLQQFSGPLDKLLELIEAKQLEITQVNLAEVTGDFLLFLKKQEGKMEPMLLADFLVIASKLVLIKSKTLLPDLELSEEEETEIKDLELRLQLYKEFTAREKEKGSASRYLNQLWDERKIALSRPLFTGILGQSFFYPGPNLNLKNLEEAVRKLMAELEQIMPVTQKIKIAVISLEEKIKELFERVKTAVTHSFRSMTEKRSRTETVVLFLALLHLFRDRLVKVEQNEQFGDIIIRSNR